MADEQQNSQTENGSGNDQTENGSETNQTENGSDENNATNSSNENSSTQTGNDSQGEEKQSSENRSEGEKTETNDESEEVQADPIESLFSEKNGDDDLSSDSENLSAGAKNFQVAAAKKFEELRDGIVNGDPKAIEAFRELGKRPKMQEAVAQKFTIEGEAIESAKDLEKFLQEEYGENESENQSQGSEFTEKDEKIIKASLIESFRDQAEKSNLKFEELKKSQEYKRVIDSAKKTIEFIKLKKLLPSDFDTIFNFEKEFAIATIEAQKGNSYREGMEQQRKISNAASAPASNATHNTNANPDVSTLVPESVYHSSTDKEWRDAYRRAHRKNGETMFSDSY